MVVATVAAVASCWEDAKDPTARQGEGDDQKIDANSVNAPS
jgi:hypothetical protein